MDEAYELFWQFNYLESEAIFQKLIATIEDLRSCRSAHLYLGLCQLFQGKSANAQSKWLSILDRDTSIDELFEFLRNIAVEFGHKFNRFDNAIMILEALQNIENQNISLTSNLDLLRDLTRFYRAGSQFNEALKAAKSYAQVAIDLPDKIFANCLLLHVLLSKGSQWEEILELADRQATLIRALVVEKPKNLSHKEANRLFGCGFHFPYIEDSPKINHALQNELVKICQDNLAYHQPPIRLKNEDRPLRIGYISHCFGRHSVGWLSRWLFKHHDHAKFQIYTYSFLDKPNSLDSVKTWIAGYSDKFYSLGYDAAEIAETIRQDRIDILVDLDSITSDVCCEVMTMKPAPVQVTWLGLDASGLPAIDYFIADPYVLPENAQEYYSEKIWRLSKTYIAVDGFEVLFPTLQRERLNIPSDAVIYFSSQG